MALLRRHLEQVQVFELVAYGARLLLPLFVMAGVVWWLLGQADWAAQAQRFVNGAWLFAATLAGLASYLGGTRLMQLDELNHVLRLFGRRFSKGV